ncbi:hypothetical protein MKW94_007470 [Papaver nudicaule]|uniref:Ubiquitin-like domain-containing protein n=1 Tax=Papaver nudicaule TaxID=74823 RepID=A0AA41W101_PAPNU|nr:hypothetical protein [Papaver nudicaule]
MSAVTSVGLEDYGTATREQAGFITVKVIYNVDKTEIFFRIRSNVQLCKLMIAYGARKDLDIKYLRFLFNGIVIKPHQTPIKLGMEDGDEIDCMQEVGGGGYAYANHQT